MPFSGRRVLVTGGTGFIGRVVCRRLLDQGAEVSCLVRAGTDAGELERMGARVLRGDITQPSTLDFSGQHIVIHAAAWVGHGLPAKKIPLFRKTNVQGTQNVLHEAKRAGVAKVVHVSSIAALGDPVAQPVTESSPRASTFRTEYERTKTEAHEIALRSAIPIAIPMPGVVIGREGPFQPLLRMAARGRLPALPRDDAVKGFVHVEDTAEGILQAAQRGTGPYLFVDENVRTTELLVAALEEAGLPVPRRRIASRMLIGAAGALEVSYKAVGRTPPVSRDLLQSLVVPMSYDSSKARKELGWRPELVKRLADDLRALARR